MALFAPFRALGLITEDVPFATQRKGKEVFVTLSVGNAWQIYNASNLRLRLVGPQLKDTIVALACSGDVTFAAVGGDIVECRRVHTQGVYHGHTANIIQMMVLGDVLVSLGKDGTVKMWRIGEYEEPLGEIVLPDDFSPTCMVHPATYLNKILIGGDDGRMQLWNISSNKMIYEFSSLGAGVRCLESSPALDIVAVGLSDGRVVLKQLKTDGNLIEFQNAAGAGSKSERFLAGTRDAITAKKANAACNSIAFRTGEGLPLMAVGGMSGVIAVWNLDTQSLHTMMRDAHDESIIHLEFLPGQPVLISSGRDNSIKEWMFDGPDGAPRLLRFRSGHSAPPTIVRHYADSKRLLSGGQDRAFRVFSTIQDAQSRELSQGHVQRRAKRLKITEQELKLARIVDLDACDVREKDWSNVISAHEGDFNAYVWRIQKFAQGEYALSPPMKDKSLLSPVTSVCLSQCGNFGFVGSASGRIDRYNMQSGLHRGTYVAFPDTKQAHLGAISGLAADGCNKYVVSGGLDGLLKCWDMKSQKLIREIDLGSKVAKLTFHPTTCLVAVSCDDLMIRICDIESGHVVRRFIGHTDRITDLQLSEDCRWLLSSSMDDTLRVWDVPGATILQVLKLGDPVTSLSLSPSMDILVTTHVEKRGLYTWANQTIFGSGDDIIASNKPIKASLPKVSMEAKKDRPEIPEEETRQKAMLVHTRSHQQARTQDSDDDISSDGQRSSSDDQEYSSGDDDSSSEDEQGAEDMEAPDISERDKNLLAGKIPVAPEMVTLSMLPRSQWLNLVHLDTIKTRNKPIEPPKKPEAAPFFLPTIAGANAGRDPVFAVTEEDEKRLAAAAAAAWGGNEGDDGVDEDTQDHETRLFTAPNGDLKKLNNDSSLRSALHQYSKTADWEIVLTFLKSLSPSQLDVQLRNLELLEDSTDDDEKDVVLLLTFLADAISSETNFEFLQALLRATILIHGDSIYHRKSLRDAATRAEQETKKAWDRMNTMLQHVQCLVGILGSIHQA